jgi:hypothetical protein
MTDLMNSDVTEADTLAADLERRIAEGDTSIKPEDVEAVEAAQKRGAFAQLRDRAAANKAAKQAEAMRRKRVVELRRQASEEFDGGELAPIVEAFDAAVPAVAEVARRVLARNERLRSMADELRNLGPLPAEIDRMYDNGVQVVEMGERRRIHPLEFDALLAEITWRAFREVVGGREALTYESAAGAVRSGDYGVGTDDNGKRLPVGLSDKLRWQVESAGK